eukprot:9244707-Pyramimonas_sp.AAC.2
MSASLISAQRHHIKSAALYSNYALCHLTLAKSSLPDASIPHRKRDSHTHCLYLLKVCADCPSRASTAGGWLSAPVHARIPQ